jgi:hypothetical protein
MRYLHAPSRDARARTCTTAPRSPRPTLIRPLRRPFTHPGPSRWGLSYKTPIVGPPQAKIRREGIKCSRSPRRDAYELLMSMARKICSTEEIRQRTKCGVASQDQTSPLRARSA